jgi:hypothetical protein
MLAILGDDRAEMELARLVRDMVPYQGFLLIRPPLEVRVYRSLRNLAILECLFHLEDEDICRRLTMTQAAIDRLRENPHHEMMRGKVVEVVERLANPRKMEEWAADNEDRLSLELVKTALYDGSTRDRTQAMNSLLDRVSAKKGREDGQSDSGMPHFPADVLKMMEMAASVTAVATRAAMRGEIDGSVLNVPRYIGSGDTHEE